MEIFRELTTKQQPSGQKPQSSAAHCSAATIEDAQQTHSGQSRYINRNGEGRQARLHHFSENTPDPSGSVVQLRLFATQRRSGVALRELLDTASGVDKLLFTGEKGMAGGADTNSQIFARRASKIGGPASAGNVGLVVTGMNISFHGVEEEPSNIPLHAGAAIKNHSKKVPRLQLSSKKLFSNVVGPVVGIAPSLR